MKKVNVTTSELLQMLEEKGYTITIQERGDSKVAFFKGRYSKPWEYPVKYTLDWSDIAMRYALANRLLQWSGYRLKVILGLS